MINKLLISPARKIFSFFSSLKTAIPLLVLTIIATIVGSMFPTPDFFKTWWYLSLLGLNGVSLLFITIVHSPMILKRKGRNALIGVVVTHTGILILIVGAIYGGFTGFRYNVKIIEGEMTVAPGLPFVIHLDELIVEEYTTDAVAHLDPDVVPKKRQESHLSFYKNGEPWATAVAAPGLPAKVDGITILPAFKEIGWYFELIVPDLRGKEKVVPVRPWSPPVIDVRNTQIMAHNRPHAPILVIGCLAMLFGLVWHFYFRHRDRSQKNRGSTRHV